uniref:NUMOD4 domain-containing protein n=1 Tax=viral metagenome TaxID=1070528 RepID=A0A6M3K1P4_9ZZZZ
MKKSIPGWPEYEITPTGKIWSVRRERWLKPSMAAGYEHIWS